MSQPAKVRDNRAKSKGRAIPPGPKAEVNWDFLERNDYLTGRHNYDDAQAGTTLRAIGNQISELEAEGRYAKARRLRKEVNLATEAQFAVRSSWCPTCLNVFHNCQCPPELEEEPASLEFIDYITTKGGTETKEARKARKKEERKKARQERKRNG